MSIKLNLPTLSDLKPRLTVIGIGGAGCNAINNMIASGLTGVDFVVANTDAQALAASSAEHSLQLGVNLTEGLGAGARPEVGQAAAEEAIEDIRAQVSGSHMVFVAAGMGGGTGTGAAAVIARAAREQGILTVGVVTKPFQFEGRRRMRVAEAGIEELKAVVDTLIVIPNQNLFLIANEKTSFGEAFLLADQVLYSGVACIVDLILKEGLINLDFADVRAVMANMGTAMMGTGEASGENRAVLAAEEAISNPLLDDVSLRGAKGLLLSITGGKDLKLFDVEAAASRVREEVDPEANIIVGATFDESLGDKIRVSIVASGMEREQRPDKVVSHMDNTRGVAPLVAPQQFERQNVAAGELPVFDNPDPGSQVPPPLPGNGQGDLGQRMPDAVPGEPAVAEQSWEAPGDVTIEVAAPKFSSTPPADPMSPMSNSPSDAPPPSDSFTLQPPPSDLPRSQTRLPSIEDFPAVGQRAYHARQTEAGSGGVSGQDGENDQRFGLIARLRDIGRGRQSDSNQNTPSRSPDSSAKQENGNDGHNLDQTLGAYEPNNDDHGYPSEPLENAGTFRRRRS